MKNYAFTVKFAEKRKDMNDVNSGEKYNITIASSDGKFTVGQIKTALAKKDFPEQNIERITIILDDKEQDDSKVLTETEVQKAICCLRCPIYLRGPANLNGVQMYYSLITTKQEAKQQLASIVNDIQGVDFISPKTNLPFGDSEYLADHVTAGTAVMNVVDRRSAGSQTLTPAVSSSASSTSTTGQASQPTVRMVLCAARYESKLSYTPGMTTIREVIGRYCTAQNMQADNFLWIVNGTAISSAEFNKKLGDQDNVIHVAEVSQTLKLQYQSNASKAKTQDSSEQGCIIS